MALLQIFLIFVLPVLLVYAGIVPRRFRFLLLAFASLLVIGFVVQEGWTLKELGIRTDNIRSALSPYTLFTIAGLLAILLISRLLRRKLAEDWWLLPYFRYFIFVPVSLLQEFGYRGFLMPKLEALFAEPILVILTNALLFAFLHIIYPKPLFQMTLGFMSGLGFAAIYYFYPNLILVSISHIILNIAAVIYSLVGWLTPEYREK